MMFRCAINMLILMSLGSVLTANVQADPELHEDATAVLAEYETLMGKAGAIWMQERFGDSLELILEARIVLDRHRATLGPCKYRSLRSRATALFDFVSAQQRIAIEQQLAAQRIEDEKTANPTLCEAVAFQHQEVQRLIDEADDHRRSGDYDAAWRRVDQALFIDPDHPEAHTLKFRINIRRFLSLLRPRDRR